MIREALERGYADEGGPNEKNQKFLKTYTEMHERNKEAWGKHSERARSEAGDEGAAEGAMTEDVAEKDEAKAGEKMTTLRSAGLEDVEWNERGTEAAKKMNDLAREVLTRIRKEQAYMLYQAEKHGAKGAVDGLSIPEDRVLRALSGRPEEDTEEAWDAYEANALAVINDVYRNLNNLVKHNREMNAAAGGYMDEYEAWMSAAKHKMAEEEKAKRKEMERVADEEYEARREENRRKIAEVNGGEHEFHAEWESMEPSEEYFIAAEDVERTNSKAFEEANKILAYEEKKIMEMPDGRKKKRALENLRLAVDVMNMPMNGIEIPNSILKDLVRNRKYEYAAQLLNRFSGTVPEAQAAVTKWYQDHGYRKAA